MHLLLFLQMLQYCVSQYLHLCNFRPCWWQPTNMMFYRRPMSMSPAAVDFSSVALNVLVSCVHRGSTEFSALTLTPFYQFVLLVAGFS
jgi:hypothetical protein